VEQLVINKSHIITDKSALIWLFMNSNFSGISTNYFKLALVNNFEVFDSIEI
jgi:hypothetical protein